MNPQKKIWVSGANGLIGQHVVSLLKLENFIVLATGKGACRVPEFEGCYESVDLTERKAVKNSIISFSPDVVIHIAAISQVDVCEENPELCYAVNVTATETIVKAAKNLGARFIFFSSDFVFEGTSSQYLITDTPNPLSVYGKSKERAEQVVQKNLSNYVIIRPILVFGASKAASRNNIFTWVVKSMKCNKQISVVDDQFRNPTYVEDVARATLSLVSSFYTGVIHLCGNTHLSVYAFAQTIVKVLFPQKADLIHPTSSENLNQSGRRPPKTGFDLSHSFTLLDFTPTSIETAIQLAYERWQVEEK